MTSSNATELINGLRNVGNLTEFAELFGFDWYDDSDWTWHDVAEKMADEFKQAIELALCNGKCQVDYYKLWWKCSCCGEKWRQVSDRPRYCPHCGSKVVDR